MNNDFLINKAEKLESYHNKWGQKGTCWVYEEKDKAPRGFLAGGEITAVDNWMNKVANDACQGFVVAMQPSSDPDKSVLKVNGSKSDSSVSVVAGKQPSASVFAEENADTVDVSSVSANVDTGDQYAKPGVIYIQYDIVVTSLAEIPNAEYYITTQVLDKDTGEFLDVSWDESAVTVTDNEDTPIPFSTNVTPCDPDERYKIFGSSITTKTDAPKMSEEEFNNIFLTVQGTVDASGLSGHTLVFINMVQVVDPDAHEEPDEPSDDGGDTVVDTSGDGDEWTEPAFDPAHDLTVVTEDEDFSEFIYIEEDTPRGCNGYYE